jgi:ABC-type transport system involved in cytochrome bd biosynthesis fused ATPase/permease subunit
MKKNMGLTDRIIRAIVAIVIVILFFTHIVTGIWAIILLIIAGIFIITSAIGFCPLYQILMINTCKKVVKKETNANM